MIKIEHVVLASPEQMQFIIEGMRNPMNSWDKSDSINCNLSCYWCKYAGTDNCAKAEWSEDDSFGIGKKDKSLMQRLSKAGTDHRKFMRMMPVYARITAPLYYWKEFDTYKVGTVANSCSTMHKISEKEFMLADFSYEHLGDSEKYPYAQVSPLDSLKETIKVLNGFRDAYIEYDTSPFKDSFGTKKDIWWQMIQLLPSSYNQTRNVMMNYEVLANMYHSRKNHKLDEWREFCKWIETLPYSYLITGKE